MKYLLLDALYILGYFFIGTFFVALNSKLSKNEKEDPRILFLWPIYISGYIIFGILYIPYLLESYLGDILKGNKK